MGVLNIFKKNNSSPVGKPFEWFLSEEGRKSFEEYKMYYSEMTEYFEEQEPEKCYAIIKALCEDENARVSNDYSIYTKVKSNRWPCIYIYWYLDAYYKQRTGQKKYGIGLKFFSIYYGTSDKEFSNYSYYLLWCMCDIACDNPVKKLPQPVSAKVKELSFPDKFSEEYNPFLYFLLRCDSFDGQSKDGRPLHDNNRTILYYRAIEQMYINAVFTDKGDDVSGEKWMYDANTYMTGKFNVQVRPEEEILAAMVSGAKYPVIMKKVIDGDYDN